MNSEITVSVLEKAFKFTLRLSVGWGCRSSFSCFFLLGEKLLEKYGQGKDRIQTHTGGCDLTGLEGSRMAI